MLFHCKLERIYFEVSTAWYLTFWIYANEHEPVSATLMVLVGYGLKQVLSFLKKVARANDPSTWEMSRRLLEEHCKFKASLGYVASSRSAWATEWVFNKECPCKCVCKDSSSCTWRYCYQSLYTQLPVGTLCDWCFKLSSCHRTGGRDFCLCFTGALLQTGHRLSLFCLFISWNLDPFLWWCQEVTGLRWICEGETWDRISGLTRGIRHHSSCPVCPHHALLPICVLPLSLWLLPVIQPKLMKAGAGLGLQGWRVFLMS